ncbi:hypothetical protein EV424DRAFT_1345347 [Suillus variegatus]|nr:hypothetical protein EV424DRAFT_1345347 [Suillus variegatus]
MLWAKAGHMTQGVPSAHVHRITEHSVRTHPQFNFYVVWADRRPDIYTTWSDYESQVSCYSGAMYQGFHTSDQAWVAFAFALGWAMSLIVHETAEILNDMHDLIGQTPEEILSHLAETSESSHWYQTKVMIKYTNITEEDRALIALNQEKAYNRINHDYLIETLESFNLPPIFVKTIKALSHDKVCLALDRQLLIVEATINDSVSGDDIRFSYYVKMLIYCQLPVAKYIIIDSMLGDDWKPLVYDEWKH